MMKLYKKYKRIKDREILDDKETLIVECYKYGIFKRKPSKSHRKWFEECFHAQYPESADEIKGKLKKQLKKTVRIRKRDEKLEEKYAKQRAKRGFSNRDAWSIYDWFLEIMPGLLQQMRDNLHGYPASACTFPNNSQAVEMGEEESQGMKRWKETLDRMIFLVKEMNEGTCSMENPYEKEYHKINRQFIKKYGFLGDGLKTKKQLKKEKRKGAHRMLSPDDFPDLYPEYKELQHNYFMNEQYITYYRDRCREEFFNLFSQHFWDLWD